MLITDTGTIHTDFKIMEYTELETKDLVNNTIKEDDIKKSITLPKLTIDSEKNRTTHYLKSYTERFELLYQNKIRSEIRALNRNRTYQEGDYCYLIDGHSHMGEWIPTGRVMLFKIKYVDLYGVEPGNGLLNYELVMRAKVTDIDEVIKNLPNFS